MDKLKVAPSTSSLPSLSCMADGPTLDMGRKLANLPLDQSKWDLILRSFVVLKACAFYELSCHFSLSHDR